MGGGWGGVVWCVEISNSAQLKRAIKQTEDQSSSMGMFQVLLFLFNLTAPYNEFSLKLPYG